MGEKVVTKKMERRGQLKIRTLKPEKKVEKFLVSFCCYRVYRIGSVEWKVLDE